jgi:hypothetical protein
MLLRLYSVCLNHYQSCPDSAGWAYVPLYHISHLMFFRNGGNRRHGIIVAQ